eukprot:g13554.t1
MKRSKLDISDAPRDVPQDVPIQDSYRTDGLGAAGSVAEGGGLRKFLLSLRDSSIDKSICRLHEIVWLQQEEAASTPGLERYAAVLAKVWELI